MYLTFYVQYYTLPPLEYKENQIFHILHELFPSLLTGILLMTDTITPTSHYLKIQSGFTFIVW